MTKFVISENSCSESNMRFMYLLMESWNKLILTSASLITMALSNSKPWNKVHFSFGGLMNIHYTFQDCRYVSESILNLERLGKISETYIDGLPKLG